MPASRRVSMGVRSTPASKYFRQSTTRDAWNRTPSHAAARARTPGKTPGKTPSKNAPAGAGSVKVVVRVRPESGKEQQGNYKVIVKAIDEQCVVFDPKEEEIPDFYQGQKRPQRDMLKKQSKDMRFAFDRVFDNQANNEAIYSETTKTLLDGLLDGYNCSVFAYGATGAGKTFTMLGTPSQPGVMFLTMMDLYQRIDALKDKKTCEVAISYLEVYNEQIKDLLLPSGYLPVREDPQNGVIVSGLSLHKPRSAEELLHMLDFGNKNRTQHPTDANAESSRSHAVFQVFVRQKERTANISAEVKVAKMSLIDLAGSERATATRNMGKRFREGANINRSLLALGNCINALAEGKSRAFVPYRDSKLTRLLKDSLGGNCRTLMIAAVSPSAMTYEDTYNTLKYANRAKNIKVELKSNVMNVDFHVTRYQQIVEELRGEITELKSKLEKAEQEPKTAASGDNAEMSLPFLQELERLQSSVSEVFDQRVFTRKELMEYESSQRELTYKRHGKQRCLNRLGIISDSSHDKEKLIAKYKRFIERSEKRLETVVQRKQSAEERMSSNTALLQKLEGDLKGSHVARNDLVSQNLALSLRCRHLEVEMRDTKRQVQFLKKLCRHQGREINTTDKLVSTLLKTVQKQYYLMQDSGLATSDIVADYEAIVREVEGEREVAWADQSVLDATIGAADTTMGDALLQDGLDYGELLDFPILHEVSFTPPRRNAIVTCSGDQNCEPQQTGAEPQTPGSYLTSTAGATPCAGLYTPGECANTPMNFSTPGGDMSIALTPGVGDHSSVPNSVEQSTSTARRALTDTISNTVQQFMATEQTPKTTTNSKPNLNSTFTMDGVEPLPVSPSGSESSEQDSTSSSTNASTSTAANLTYTASKVTCTSGGACATYATVAAPKVTHSHSSGASSSGGTNTSSSVTNVRATMTTTKTVLPSAEVYELQPNSTSTQGHFQPTGLQSISEAPHEAHSASNGHGSSACKHNYNTTKKQHPRNHLQHHNSHPQHNQTSQQHGQNQQQHNQNQHLQQHNQNHHHQNSQHQHQNTHHNPQHHESENKHKQNHQSTQQQDKHHKETSKQTPVPTERHRPLNTTITLEPGESLVDSPVAEKDAKSTRNTTPELPTTPQRVSPSADLANGEKPHFRRVVDFQQENMPSPAGRMTFADVVKSPIVAKVQAFFSKPLSDLRAPTTPRSPLAPRQNLPDVTPSSQKKRDKDTGSSSSKKWSRLARTSNKKYALPSVIESINKLRRAQTFNAHDTGPRYMQMTKAATRRHRNHRRSLSGTLEPQVKSSIPAPGKVPVKPASSEVKENKPVRSLANRKWISSTAIGQRSTFL